MQSVRLNRVFHVIGLVCNLLLGFQVVIVCYIVFARFVLNDSPSWGEEFSLLLMIWFCLLSPAMAIRDERHLNINICKSIFPGFVLKLISLGNYILIFGFSLFMVFEGYGLTILTKRNILPGMGVPASVLYISIPISGLLFCLAAGEKFLQLLRRSGNELKESGCRDGL